VVGGDSYGQGSSREHAALCPMYLGVRVVIAKAIERIHKANLINFCIVPIEFGNPADYDRITQDDVLEIPDLLDAVKNEDIVTILDKTAGFGFAGKLSLSQRDRDILLAGGLLAYTRKKAGK
jgi:aconitate hydratase